MSRATKNTDRVAAIELGRELAECRADAARYKHCCDYWGCELREAFSLSSKELIDAAIDKDIASVQWAMENPE